jgi:hypothetical protein
MINHGKDMKKHPSIRQMKYARGLQEENMTKQQIALEAGYSPSSARVPKLIENKAGFKLAVAQLAGEVGNVTGKIMAELQVRDLSKMDNKTLIGFLDVATKTHERLASKIL